MSQAALATPEPPQQGGPLGGVPLLPTVLGVLVVVLAAVLVIRRR
ncbi:hypothetical protein ACFQRB_02650 [Halobaculum litoreum]|uniref:PGF-CTERM protein n=1 Tax=Halobaculum litoreum TaxID=3031998 RepID=A0ABD5XQ47_9EURY